MNRTFLDLKAKYRQLILAQGERGLRRLEQAIGRASLIGDRAFFDPQQFGWVTTLEANWQIIRVELDRVLQNVEAVPNFQDISADQYSITQDDRWKTFFFYAYGIKLSKNCDRCPQTAQLLQQIPDMKTAFFSILLPHKQIPEHRGPYKGVVRYHLALKVPQAASQCGIRVGDEVRHWEAGKSLMFDDTLPHAAWNETDEIRVILFVDVLRPLRFPWSIANRLMVGLIAISPYIQAAKANFDRWEQQLERLSR